MCHLIKQLMTFHFGGHWFINPLEVINHSVHLMKSHWIGLKYNYCRGRMVVGFTTIYAISVYHHWRCDFESRSGEMYSKQQYMIKFVSDLRQVGGFLRVLRFPPPIKHDHHDITEILLKGALNTINQYTTVIIF